MQRGGESGYEFLGIANEMRASNECQAICFHFDFMCAKLSVIYRSVGAVVVL